MIESARRPGNARLVVMTTVPITLTFFEGQSSYMATRGFDVHVVSSPGAALDRFAAREPVARHEVEMRRRISPLQDLIALVRLVRLLRRIRPSIVHAHTPKAGLLGMIAARMAGVTVRIYHIHGLPFVTARGLKRRLLMAAERTACRLAAVVLCVSRSVRQVAVDEGICPADRVSVLGAGSINGVDALGRFDPRRMSPEVRVTRRATCGIPADALVVGFVGRLVRDKGIVELASAWGVLRDEIPTLHLLMVGASEEHDRVPEDVLSCMRADPRIHFVGEDRDTSPFYASMDVVCLPTHREGLPVVPLEAAAMGLPVVATSVPGCVDAIDHGRTGMLVAAGDAQALAAALRLYLQSPELRRTHGAAGRRRVLAMFRPTTIWEAQYRAYSELLRAQEQAWPRSRNGNGAAA